MYHSIIIAGSLGGDPEMRYMPNGNAVTNFSVATNRKYTAGDGNQVSETTWFRVSVFGKSAEACNKYLCKGSRVLVVGRLSSDKATGGPKIWNKSDGTPSASFEVVAETVRFLSRDERQKQEHHTPGHGAEYDDIPF